MAIFYYNFKTMKLTVLGSGTYFPELNRHCSSYLINTVGKNLVFDFGRGAIDQLLRLGVSYDQIDDIFISHIHADHCSELSSLLHIGLVESSWCKLRKKELSIYGPQEIKETVDHLVKAFNLQNFHPPHKINVFSVRDGESIKGEGWTVRAFKTRHSTFINSLSFRLEAGGKTFCYSGDTANCPGLRKACQSADLAVIESSDPKEFYQGDYGHLTGEVTGEVAEECGVKKLILTHVSPYYLENYNVKEEAKKTYSGSVFIAKDLMEMEI